MSFVGTNDAPMMFGIGLLKSLLKFIPAKWKVREEVKAQGEGQLALGQSSLDYWERLGWPPQAARYLATAFTFGVRENIAAVMEKAQQLSDSSDFGQHFANRVLEDPSVRRPYIRGFQIHHRRRTTRPPRPNPSLM